MKIFIDTANLDEIKEAAAMGILDGVTTNPSLVSKEGHKDFRSMLEKITQLVDGDISAEVVSMNCDEMLKEGREYAKIHKNIVVKVPLIKEGLKAVKIFAEEGIRTNVTLCFTPSQAVLAAKAGAYIISPFVGRLDDISVNGMDMVADLIQIYKNYNYKTQVLVASIRHPIHFVDSCLLGADIGTMPFKIIEMLFKHPLTDSGLTTFSSDWAKLQAENKDKKKIEKNSIQ